MSRAFVRETDETFESLPDRPVSAHQNLVTPEGLVQIEAMLARLREERAGAQMNERPSDPGPDRSRPALLDLPTLHRPGGPSPEGYRGGSFRLHGDDQTR